ncbi:MAG: biotin/lipoyl-binding protein, partial [bacterium]
MKENFKKVILPITVLVLASLFSISCGKNGAAKNQEEEDVELVPVEVTSVIEEDVSFYVSTTATLEAEQEAQIIAKAEGLVKDIYVEEGDLVKEGEILASLEDSALLLLLKQAELKADNAKRE